MTTLPFVYRVNFKYWIGSLYCSYYIDLRSKLSSSHPVDCRASGCIFIFSVCLWQTFLMVSIMGISYLFIVFLLFAALPLWPTGILPSVLIFLCCSYLCNLCLSSVCLCHVFIFYIIHAKYMSIFDRFLLFAALPLWPAVLQPSVLNFLCSYYLYILRVFISISLYTSKCLLYRYYACSLTP